MTATIKKESAIILQHKSKIVEGSEMLHSSFINLLLLIRAATGGPVLVNIYNKVLML